MTLPPTAPHDFHDRYEKYNRSARGQGKNGVWGCSVFGQLACGVFEFQGMLGRQAIEHHFGEFPDSKPEAGSGLAGRSQ